MDFYIHFLCRAYRHSNIVDCENTQEAATLVVCQMMFENADKSIIENTGPMAWLRRRWDAEAAVNIAVELIIARRERVEDWIVQRRADTSRIDAKGRIAAHFDRQTRSRWATFA